MTKSIPYKQWVMEEAERIGIKPKSVYESVRRGHRPELSIFRINRRVVFVEVQEECGNKTHENP